MRPLLAIALLGAVLVDSACDYCGHDTATHDQLALMEVRRIRTAQVKFYAGFRRYGTFSDLGPRGAKLLSSKIVNDEYAGYHFTLQITGEKYSVQALPDKNRTGATRSFYCDQTGVIRQSWTREPASASSPEVQELHWDGRD